MNLACVLADAASAHPERPALLFEGERVSYGELDRRAAVAAAALEERGVRKDDRVALKLPNTPDYIGRVLRDPPVGGGRGPAQRPPGAAGGRHAARGGVADGVRRLAPTCRGRSAPGDRRARRGRSRCAALHVGDDRRAEGAVLTHGGISAATRFGADALSFTDSDVVLGVAPFPHVLGQQVFFSSFAVGAAVCVMQRFEPEPALATMAETGTTVLMGVPTMCITLSQAAQTAGALPPLRIAHIGGAAVPIDVARRFEETFAADIHEGYGLTEMSGLATTFAIGRLRKPGSVGRPSSSTDVRIANPDERGVGEVQFRGPSVIHGYWNDPAATAAAIDPEGWLSTGDLGRLDEGGDLFLVDRKKEMIIRGGYNVYPREVEEVLYEHPSVLEAAVIGVPHETLGEDVAAVVVARPATELDPDELKAWAKERVAAYKYPRHVVVVDELPKSPTGKILKRSIDLASLFEEVERST